MEFGDTIVTGYMRALAKQQDAEFMEMLSKGYEISELELIELQGHPETWYIGVRGEPIDVTKLVDHGSIEGFFKFLTEPKGID